MASRIGSRVVRICPALTQRFTSRSVPPLQRFGKLLNPLEYRCFARDVNLHRPASSTFQLRLQHTDARVLTNAQRIQAVTLNKDQLQLELTSADGDTFHFPYIYLRDNCQCSECWHPSTLSRKVIVLDVDLNIQPTDAQISNEGLGIEITWPDGHKTSFSTDWLLDRSFTKTAQEKRRSAYGQEHQMWGSELKDKLQPFKFSDLINDDNVLLKWLLELEKYGLTVIQDAPREQGQLQRIGERICFLRRTNYGNTFDVKSKADPSNLAYTNARLSLHVDLPFYYHMPSIQMLHCIRNTSTGGENQFADGSYAAIQLREIRPDLFKVLTETLVDFNDVGKDHYVFHKVHRHPIIKFDYEGRISGIFYNNAVRDNFLNVPIDKVRPLYEGIKMLGDIMYDPKNRVDLMLSEGDIFAFENIRVLHGRSQYEMGPNGERILEGAYLDWDEVKSRIRVLKHQLA